MKPNRILAIALGCVAVLALVAWVVDANRRVPEYDPASPEGTVQAYLEAVLSGDADAAFAYLAEDTRCVAEDFRGALADDSLRVVLRDVEIEGERAEVAVEISFTGGGPFDAYEWSEHQRFFLVREENRWAIAEVPWPLFFCGGDHR